MSRDRITQLRISGLRAIEDLTLALHGLTVLIGDNGTGKSSILEALELLRLAAKPISFVQDVVSRGHGGMPALLRRGANELKLGVTIEGAGPPLVYEIELGLESNAQVRLSERLGVYDESPGKDPSILLLSNPTTFLISSGAGLSNTGRRPGPGELALPRLGDGTSPMFQRAIDALEGIEIHVPFETRPTWQQREFDIRKGPRWPSEVEPTDQLQRYALNLPNAFQQLRNLGGEVWDRVIVRARLGLGDDVRDFRLSPSGRGNIELELVLGSAPDQPLPAEYLSEGQLAYLAFIALVELDERRSVLAFDEPELHLHPALLARVIFMLEDAAERAPVILATHSDRLLDALGTPERSVVLCDLDEHRTVRLRRPNEDKLAEWLEDYRGLGSLRAEGYDTYVFDSPAEPEEGESS
ncbi:AAA family ATPase [Paraliomyxa miuraensis]|uniref:AAA family ATPase n=1 Tax=Paraliomyxa miuraensis TaxID=376150 RepID=UPI00224D882D|nr:AAA family ATPase [Paraliomyxa miuraensis]MCX4243382.1 AAA family ATPase [Paraliomyxa miuraensis]